MAARGCRVALLAGVSTGIYAGAHGPRLHARADAPCIGEHRAQDLDEHAQAVALVAGGLLAPAAARAVDALVGAVVAGGVGSSAVLGSSGAIGAEPGSAVSTCALGCFSLTLVLRPKESRRVTADAGAAVASVLLLQQQ